MNTNICPYDYDMQNYNDKLQKYMARTAYHSRNIMDFPCPNHGPCGIQCPNNGVYNNPCQNCRVGGNCLRPENDCKGCKKMIITNSFKLRYSLLPEEKIILEFVKKEDCGGNRCSLCAGGTNKDCTKNVIYISNWGRIIQLYIKPEFYTGPDVICFKQYNELNLWIPPKIIINMNTIFNNVTNITIDQLINFINFGIESIKIKDEYTEKLIKLQSDIQEMDKFKQDQKQFYEDEKPFLDLIESKNGLIKQKMELDVLRNNLQIMAKKLKLEKLQLDKEKDILNNINLEGFEL